MTTEIERKFLLKKKPSLVGKTPVLQERFFLFNQNGIELRIQQKGNRFELERKTTQNKLSRTTQKIELTKQEYDSLKKNAAQGTKRKSYLLLEKPRTSLKEYTGQYTGLIRAEVEFDTEQEARQFKPFDWMGPEITSTPLGQDKSLSQLNRTKFQKWLKKLSK